MVLIYCFFIVDWLFLLLLFYFFFGYAFFLFLWALSFQLNDLLGSVGKIVIRTYFYLYF